MNEMHYIPRLQEEALRSALASHPVVVLQGARQTGKSTLARSGAAGPRHYLTLDDYDLRELARRDPGALLDSAPRLTIDEIQREPELLLVIKREVDRRRTPGRFLLTGSANLLLMHKVSESLAGRAVYLRLPGLTCWETPGGRGHETLARLLTCGSSAEVLAELERSPAGRSAVLLDAIARGGFPVPALDDDVQARRRWFDGYEQTYLERDLRSLAMVGDLVEFRRLMRLAALQTGGLLNQATLARDSGLSVPTVTRYLSMLERSFILARVPAFTVSRRKRLIKAPKVYWTDTGLAAHLAGADLGSEALPPREAGIWLENWVLNHLLAFGELQSPPLAISHWRAASGQEVDVVLEAPRALLPVECKLTSRPSGSDLRGLESFLDEHPQAKFGLLLCRSPEPRLLSRRIIAVPLECLLPG